MVDAIQILILLVVISVTVLLVVLGIQVYFILRDLRGTIVKANRVLDQTSTITQSVSGPIASLSSIATGVTTGTMVIKALKTIRNALAKEDKDGKQS